MKGSSNSKGIPSSTGSGESGAGAASLEMFSKVQLRTVVRRFLPIVIGVLAALPFFFSPRAAKDAFFLEITLQSNVANGTARVYYDYGAGFNEWDTSSPAFRRSNDAPDLQRFPLPSGRLLRLRLDPFDSQGAALLIGARICDADGRTVRSFNASEFLALHDIASLTRVSESSVRLVTTEGGTDPYLALELNRPLKLRAPFDFFGRSVSALPVFAFVFAGLVFVAWWQRRQRTAGGGASATTFPNWAAVVGVGVVLFARQPDRFLNPQFYAEDGFWYTSYISDGIKTFVTPYGGYLLSVDRLVAWLTTLAPLTVAPYIMNGAALLFTLAVAWRVISPRNPLPYKPWLAIAIVLVPRLDDIFMTITNIQWVLSIALVVLLISDDTDVLSQRLYDYATAVVSGLSGVYCIITLPLFGLRLFRRRSAHSTALFALLGLTAALQAWFVIHTPPLQPQTPFPLLPEQIPAVVGFQLFAHLFGGTWMQPTSVPFLAGLGILTGVLAVVLAWPIKGPSKRNEPKFFLAAVAVLFSAASIYRFKGMLAMFLSPEGLSRYFLIPQLIIIWLLICGLSLNRFRRVLSSVLLVALGATTLLMFRAPALIDFHWHAEVKALQPGQSADIPINPKGWRFRTAIPPTSEAVPRHR